MPASPFTTLHSALKQLWYKKLGVGNGDVPAFDNGVVFRYRNAANTDDIEALRFGDGTNDVVSVGGVGFRPWYQGVPFPLDVAFTDRHFFVNPCPFPVTVKAIYVTFSTTETTTTTLSAVIEKLTGTKAAGSGVAITSAIALTGTADIPVAATLLTTVDSSGAPYVQLARGERLAWNITGAVTELAGVTITVFFDTGGRVEFRNVIAQDNTRCIDRHAHVANVPKTILYQAAVWGVKAGAAANFQPRRGQGTETSAQGDALTTAVVDLTGDANTVVYPTNTATVAYLTLDVGDRIDMDFGGTVTTVRNLVYTIAHTPQRDGFEVDCQLLLDADVDNVSRRHFVAHQNIQAIQSRFIHAVADAGEFVDLETAHSAVAPGSGTGIITDGSGNGFDAGATAETVQVGTMVELGVATMRQLDGLDTQGSDTDDTLVNVAATVNFRAAA